jgi:hypothetical protein
MLQDRMRESYALVVDFNNKEQLLPLLPDRPTVPRSPHPARPTQQPDAPPSIPRNTSRRAEPNNGFHSSTSITLYQAPTAPMAPAGTKRSAPSDGTLPPAKRIVTADSSEKLRAALTNGQSASRYTRAPTLLPQHIQQSTPHLRNGAHALSSQRPEVTPSMHQPMLEPVLQRIHQPALQPASRPVPQILSPPALPRQGSFASSGSPVYVLPDISASASASMTEKNGEVKEGEGGKQKE